MLRYEPTAGTADSSLPTLADLEFIFPPESVDPLHELFLFIEGYLRGLGAQEVVLMNG